jgi:hypothetical protein
MALQGKGFMIWQIPNCEGGDPVAIANVAASAGLTHVLIKIADGNYAYNFDRTKNIDLVPPVAQALRANGIKVWGWHYVYGNDPLGEAHIAIQRVQKLALDGYVIDAEGEYKEAGKDVAATHFMAELRASLPSTPVALCSFRYPSYHPQLPWKQFLDKCDYNMPQVYWMQAHNAGAQLTRSVNEFKAMTPFRPIIPTGPACSEAGWQPTAGEVLEFLNTARSLNLSASNFFAWDDARRNPNLKSVWDTIASFPWGPTPQPQDILYQYIAALNSHDPAQVINYFGDNAVHITAAQTITGKDAIKNWFSTFLNNTLPGGSFVLTSTSGSGTTRSITWQATSSKGKVQDGADTFGILNNKITYQYSSYTVV